MNEGKMRRNFAEVLKSGKIDLKKEYSKLFMLFYEDTGKAGVSLADYISANFMFLGIRGTCIDLEDFNEHYGFHFVEQPQNFDIDYFVSFCEYVYNVVIFFEEAYLFGCFNKNFYLEQINVIIESIGYEKTFEDKFIIFVPKDNVSVEVSKSDLIPKNVSYKVIAYNHHSMKGNLESKKQTLLIFADLLEPKKKELNLIDKAFASDLFYAFNNFNIRHNNIDPAGTKYKEIIGNLTQEQLEKWYDETYQMCLFAFMLLEHKTRKKDFDKLKSKIEEKH